MANGVRYSDTDMNVMNEDDAEDGVLYNFGYYIPNER